MKRPLPKRNLDLEVAIRKRFRSFTAFSWIIEEHVSVISRVLNGWQTIGEDKQEKWAKALGCQARDIFK